MVDKISGPVGSLLCREASVCLMKWLSVKFREQVANESVDQNPVSLGYDL